MIKDCRTWEDYLQLVEDSHEQPVLLFKHSTRCPVSATAWRNFQRLADGKPAAALWRVLVIENREMSSRIADHAGVRHQSPQALLFRGGRVVWHDSHWSITTEDLEDAVEQAHEL